MTFRLIIVRLKNFYFVALFGLFYFTSDLKAQSSDSLRHGLRIDFELRPRAEYKDHYQWTPADTAMSALIATQRNRLNITYQTSRLKLHASPQEIHVWGTPGQFSKVGNLNFYELYAEPKLSKHLSLRMGRQALLLDNGRIFSSAPWAQQGRSHEGMRLFYKNRFETDLTIAFTRSYSKQFDASYSPVAANNYKYLLVHHLKYRFANEFTLTTINTVDVFRRTTGDHTYYARITNGGRLEYTKRWFAATVSAYYQHGQDAVSKPIRSYYIQPEISANTGKTLIRLGAEIMSGNRYTTPSDANATFVPLYGVAWRFMGNMNLFTRFPADVNNKGLVNPYLFVIYQAGPKLSLRADAHLFYTQHPLISEAKNVENRNYLGFESDLSLIYKPTKVVEIKGGFSFALTEKRMELLNKVPDAGKVPIWSYVMVSYTPRLLARRW